MKIPFYKFQGTGNDFVIIDQFDQKWISVDNQDLISKLCDRKFGIGADGLILLQKTEVEDFEMIYFNADGRPGSLCGNGSRCAVACMRILGRVEDQCTFEAYDGVHVAKLDHAGSYIDIHMGDVSNIERGKGFFVLDTGSPHYVTEVEDLSDLDVNDVGQKIRYSDRFRKTGINVNFVEVRENAIEVHTYERGVEAETLSCGTGVTAAALAHAEAKDHLGRVEQNVVTKGGDLKVRFKRSAGGFEDIWLCGPTELVFSGEI